LLINLPKVDQIPLNVNVTSVHEIKYSALIVTFSNENYETP
jgi:hypothetical protein